VQMPLRLVAAILLASVPPPAAEAHSAPSGWAYDSWCCGGHDCEPIPEDQVRVTPEGYVVTIPNGSHVTAHGDVRQLFHYDEVRFSGDGEYHACILPRSQEFRCLYVPRMGF
jgi:hypothetical protein